MAEVVAVKGVAFTPMPVLVLEIASVQSTVEVVRLIFGVPEKLKVAPPGAVGFDRLVMVIPTDLSISPVTFKQPGCTVSSGFCAKYVDQLFKENPPLGAAPGRRSKVIVYG